MVLKKDINWIGISKGVFFGLSWTDMIYWADSNDRAIKRSFIPHADSETRSGYAQALDIPTVTRPDGISLDWTAGNIYWTDTRPRTRRDVAFESGDNGGTLSVATLDGRYPKTLFVDATSKPAAVAVNPQRGLIYWTMIGERPRIMSAWMDGSNAKVIVADRLGHPTGLAIDFYQNGRLYWADSKGNVIESANFDGSDRRIILSKSRNILNIFPFYFLFLDEIRQIGSFDVENYHEIRHLPVSFSS